MNREQVFKLLDAGFSADEIRAMDGGEQPKPEEKPEVKPDGGEQPKPEAKPETKSGEQPKTESTNDMVIAAINKLTQTIQANAFFRDGGSGGSGNGQTAEEILSGFFADPNKKDKK